MSGTGELAGTGAGRDGGLVSPRVFISYAHGDATHEEQVRAFWLFLREQGIDARMDLPGSEERRDWPQWMTRQVQHADRILVIASPEYKRRAEGHSEPEQGRGVQWEAWLIRNRFYADQAAGVRLVLPVVLPSCSAGDIPIWLAPAASTYYKVTEFAESGAETLLRALTGQPLDIEPPLGPLRRMPPRRADAAPRITSTLPDVGPFIGRKDYQERLSIFLSPSNKVKSNVMLITGQPGIGKTALAVKAIETVKEAECLPSDVLFVDLREHDPDSARRLTLNSALGILLRQLGLCSEEIPPDDDGREMVFHAKVAEYSERGKPLILLIDNVADYRNVRSLIPSADQHRVLVTSRYTMPELNSSLIEVGALSLTESIDLIQKLASAAAERGRRLERRDVQGLAALCVGLPLALCLAAGRLVIEPHLAVSDLVNELSETSDRLEGLSVGDRAIRAVFETSYERLTPDQARMLRLSILHHGPQFSVSMAAAVLGSPENKVRRILAELCRGHLIIPGNASGYYSTHDLIYDFAASLVRAENDVDGLTVAAQRLFEYWRSTALAASDHLDGVVPPNSPSGPFMSYHESLDWLDTVSPSMVPLARMADEAGHIGDAATLAPVFSAYFTLRRRFAELYEVSRIAVLAARKMDAKFYEAEGLNNAGIALQGMRKYSEAASIYEESRCIFESISYKPGVANTTGNLGVVYELLGRVADAIECHHRDAKISIKRGDLSGYAAALNNLGLAYLKARQFRNAIRTHRYSCSIAFAAGDVTSKIKTTMGLGASYSATGRYDKAVKCYRRTKDLCRLIDDRYDLAVACGGLGRAQCNRGNLWAAVRELTVAHAIFIDIGDAESASSVAEDLAFAKWMQHQFDLLEGTADQDVDEVQYAAAAHTLVWLAICRPEILDSGESRQLMGVVAEDISSFHQVIFYALLMAGAEAARKALEDQQIFSEILPCMSDFVQAMAATEHYQDGQREEGGKIDPYNDMNHALDNALAENEDLTTRIRDVLLIVSRSAHFIHAEIKEINPQGRLEGDISTPRQLAAELLARPAEYACLILSDNSDDESIVRLNTLAMTARISPEAAGEMAAQFPDVTDPDPQVESAARVRALRWVEKACQVAQKNGQCSVAGGSRDAQTMLNIVVAGEDIPSGWTTQRILAASAEAAASVLRNASSLDVAGEIFTRK
jgi:tetratricopeptide (TPR) repeat protein